MCSDVSVVRDEGVDAYRGRSACGVIGNGAALDLIKLTLRFILGVAKVRWLQWASACCRCSDHPFSAGAATERPDLSSTGRHQPAGQRLPETSPPNRHKPRHLTSAAPSHRSGRSQLLLLLRCSLPPTTTTKKHHPFFSRRISGPTPAIIHHAVHHQLPSFPSSLPLTASSFFSFPSVTVASCSSAPSEASAPRRHGHCACPASPFSPFADIIIIVVVGYRRDPSSSRLARRLRHQLSTISPPVASLT